MSNRSLRCMRTVGKGFKGRDGVSAWVCSGGCAGGAGLLPVCWEDGKDSVVSASKVVWCLAELTLS